MIRLSLKRRRARCDESRRVARALEARIAVLLGLEEGDRVAVNEIVCADWGCPEVETVALIMRPGKRTRALKIAKEIGRIEEADILASIAAADLS